MMNTLQTYMVHEYVADYKAGYLSRRDLVRRVLNITGGLGHHRHAAAGARLRGASRWPPTRQPPRPRRAKPTTAPAAASPAASPALAQSPSASPAAAPSASPSAAVKPAASPAASARRSWPSARPRPWRAVRCRCPPTIRPSTARTSPSPAPTAPRILAYQARPKSASGPLPLVLVCHENRGLTEHIRDVTRRFTKEGFMACAVDLVSRQGGTANITDPNAFSTHA